MMMTRSIANPTDAAIVLRNVTGGYTNRPIVSDVSLEIPQGAFVGLVGPSGAGKTSLLKAMLGTLPRVSGEIILNGVPVRSGTPPAGIGYVPQTETVDWTFPVTVEQVVMMGRIRSMGMLPWASRKDRAAVAETLERLGIGGLAGRHIRDLSGGQQQRVFIARALIGSPRLVLLDEPTASVDIKTRDDILHLLVDLNLDGTTIVMTTHELNAVAAHLPWVVCVNGGIVAQGHPRDAFTNAILSKTFGAPMRVLVDEQTGGILVAEGHDHGPFGDRLIVAAGGQPSAIGAAAAPLPLSAD